MKNTKNELRRLTKVSRKEERTQIRGKIEVADPLKSLLDEVKSLFKRGMFDSEELRLKIEELRKAVHAHKPFSGKVEEDKPKALLHLKSRCIISEYDYYFDNIGGARKAVAEVGLIFHEQLLSGMKNEVGILTSLDRELFREKVRFCLDYAQANYYHNHDYKNARIYIKDCIDFVEKKLRRRDFMCWGSLSQAYYYLGKVERQRGSHNDALAAFVNSITCSYKRKELKEREAENPEDDISFCQIQVAIALGLGSGFVHFVQSSYDLAESALVPAKLILDRFPGDFLRRSYIDLLLGSVRRTRARTDEEQDEAIELINGAYETFSKSKHKKFLARAAYEMSQAYLYRNVLEEAEVKAKQAYDLSKDSPRWTGNALVVMSRIKLKSNIYDKAEEKAKEAYKIAKDNEQTMVMVDALIAGAEAKLSWAEKEPKESEEFMKIKLEEARENLKEALELNLKSSPSNPNPKITGFCNILIAESFAIQGDGFNAKLAYGEWEKVEKDVIEHLAIRNRSEDVKRMIDRLPKGFFVGPDEDLNYKRKISELKNFLFSLAKEKYRDDEAKQIEILGLTRQGFSKIKERIKERPKKSEETK